MKTIEILGIISTSIILISKCFKTMTFTGSLWMRIINIVGNSLFTIYAILIGSISSTILGAGIVIVNVVHLVILIVNHNKENANLKGEKT